VAVLSKGVIGYSKRRKLDRIVKPRVSKNSPRRTFVKISEANWNRLKALYTVVKHVPPAGQFCLIGDATKQAYVMATGKNPELPFVGVVGPNGVIRPATL